LATNTLKRKATTPNQSITNLTDTDYCAIIVLNMTEIDTFQLDSRDADLQRPTHEAFVYIAEHEGLDIGVGVVDARKKSLETGELEGRTIIWPMAYLARMDAFETQRLVVVAEALNARVVGVETAGVGVSEDAKSLFLQKLDLLKGNFNSSAHAMLGALRETIDFADGDEVEFLLFSQGVALGVAMIEDLGKKAHGLDLSVPKVTIIEAVNDQPWNLKKLLDAIGKEDKYTDRYLDENKRHEWLEPPSDRTEAGKIERKKLDRKQLISTLLGGAALRKSFNPVLL